MSKTTAQNQASEQITRPPVVVVMGHVDHGKTTLLDYIRKTRVAEREAGGITQATGAYEIVWKDKKITFIDTPGHQAFTCMRQRGADIADLAVLVVAADDGVKPQTKEAIDILKKCGTPFVVAINKIDKNNADPERTRQSLMGNSVLLEKYGGDIAWVEISAKLGTGVDELLDHLLLMWEMEPGTCNLSAPGKGFVLESHRNGQQGIVVSVIIKDGTVRTGEQICTKSAYGKIRALETFSGARTQLLQPSSPARIIGFESLPETGEEFFIGAELDAFVNAAPMEQEKKNTQVISPEEDAVKIILKADVSGSLEALSQVLLALSLKNLKLHIVSQEVGEVSDGDVKLASTTGATIIAFNVKVTKPAENLAMGQHVKIVSSDIIYRLIERLEEMDEHANEKPVAGILEILAVFSNKNKKWLIGGKVVEGRLLLQDKFTVSRADAPLGRGRITNLQRNKMDAKRVEEGECGLMVETPVELKVGDHLIVEFED